MSDDGTNGAEPAGQGARPARKAGLAHLFAAAGHSAAGLRRLARESAFRQEVAIGAALLAGLALWGVAPGRLAILAVLLLVLVAIEALNTAIELLVDRLSPEWSEFARDAKDLGSLAVAAVVVAIAIFSLWAVLD